jgi:hypothetical protein
MSTLPSALRKKGGKLDVIQIDASVNPGNSGGPVIDQKGNVVGIIVAGILGTGVSFAIPVSHLQQFLTEPGLVFEVPTIKYADRAKAAKFEFEVVQYFGANKALNVVIGFGDDKATQKRHNARRSGTKYTVTAAPFAKMTAKEMFVGQTTMRIAVTQGRSVLVKREVPVYLDGSPGLVGHYRFDEGQGDVANDSSDSNNHGEVHDLYRWEPQGGKFGGTLLFDGRRTHVKIKRLVENDFTIALWVKTPMQDSRRGNVANWFHGLGLVDADVLNVKNDFGLVFMRGKVGFGAKHLNKTVQSKSEVNDNKWHHVTATRNGSTGECVIYVDGIQEGAITSATGPLNASPTMAIGKINSSRYNVFAGWLDDVRIYNRVLGGNEVNWLAGSTAGGASESEATVPDEIAGTTLPAIERPPRIPVPDADALDEANQLVEDTFRDQREQAKSRDEKIAFVENILDAADKTEKDHAGRFVLLRTARDVAAEVGDLQLSMNAADRLVSEFEVEDYEVKIDALQQLGKALESADAVGEFATYAEPVARQAGEHDEYDAALALAGLLLNLAKEKRATESVKIAVALKAKLSEMQSAFADVAAALEALKSDPDDPDANQTAGMHRCFHRGDWDGGLPLLAKAKDEALRNLAAGDLAEPANAKKQSSVGDAWWEHAHQQPEADRNHALARAAHWYEQSLPRLKGFTKLKAQKRLAKVTPNVRISHDALGYALRAHPENAEYFNGHWYKVFEESTSWKRAHERCKAMGGYLVCIETEEELEHVEKLRDGLAHVCVGGQRNDLNWSWINGKPLGITPRWNEGQPDNGDNIENCLEILGSGRWNDIAPNNSSRLKGLICEWEF